MFAKTQSGFELLGYKADKLSVSLPKGLYSLTVKRSFMGSSFLIDPVTRYDNTKPIKAGVFADAANHIEDFYTDDMCEIRKEMGELDKTSLIFKGIPGAGKTHLACTLAKHLTEKYDAIAVVINSISGLNLTELTDKLRINDSQDRKIIYILDELEKNDFDDLTNPKFLGFLDGAESRSNVVVFATANRVDRLPDFLLARPGRFEKIYEFSLTDESIMDAAIDNLLPEKYKTNVELVAGIRQTAILAKIATIDHLRFVIKDALFAFVKANRNIPEPATKKLAKKAKAAVN